MDYFSPHYDSPLEADFAYHLYKYVHPDHVSPQVEVKTELGTFRLDFAITNNQRTIAIECDGKDYHDLDRDAYRDQFILRTGRVQAIYRFRGKLLHFFPNDALYIVARLDPWVFTDRGLKNIHILASCAVKGLMDKFMDKKPEERFYSLSLHHKMDHDHMSHRIMLHSLEKKYGLWVPLPSYGRAEFEASRRTQENF